MKYRLLLLKRMIEDVGIYPLILAGRLIAFWKPLPKEYAIFYFFPFYHTGGAEKVHALIAKATGDKDCIIFFTRRSHNDGFLQAFKDSGCAFKDISKYTDNKWLYPVNLLFRGIISGYINRQKQPPVIFNGQSNFGYKISPWIHQHIRQIELIHSVSNFSYIRIPFLPFITRTVMISTVKIKEHLQIYRRYGIPLVFDDKIQFIMNAIDLPDPKPSAKSTNEPFIVLYVGRGTPEKRVPLIAQVAMQVKQQRPNIVFQFLGEVAEAIPEELLPYCELLGNQTDEVVINDVYRKAQVLILLSDTEGFPMVVMEAMARGLAIIATTVGELPLHIKDGISGFAIGNYRNESSVREQSATAIMQLYQDRGLLHRMAAYNIEYAFAHFGMQRFENEYRVLLAVTKQRIAT